jgi:hypothetical protein
VAVTLDRIGERYGLLPSEVLARATTLDIAVMDVSISYEQMRSDKKQGKTPNMKEEDMLAILEKAKGAR